MTRLHPLSALTDAVQRALQFGSFALFASIMLSGPLGVVDVLPALLLAPLAAVVGAGYAVARYLRFEYDLGPERLVVTSGVFSRQEREIPLRRIQNVDVSRSLVQRVLGLATVRFETAGGSATEAELDAVGAEDAERLRHQVGERVRALREGERSTGAAVDDEVGAVDTGGSPGEAGTTGVTGSEVAAGGSEFDDSFAGSRGETLYEISARDLLVLSAISFRPGAIAAPVFGAPFVGDAATRGGVLLFRFFGGGREGGATDLLAAAFTALVGLVAFAVTVWIASAALTYARYYDFRLERVADELRYERGLLGRYSGTVPLEKVQTVSIGENVAMRRLGYATLSVETAGYAPGSNRAGGAETTIPLAARGRVLDLARDLQPFGRPTFERPPTRARRRYAIRYALVSVGLAAVVLGASWLWTPLPAIAAAVPLVGLALAPIAARSKWRHRGYDERERAMLTRSGFWYRSTRVVPYYRLQTVFARRTIFQRRWDLASLTADTASTTSIVGGDATAHDIDGDEADDLRERLLDRLREDLAERRGRSAGGSEGSVSPDTGRNAPGERDGSGTVAGAGEEGGDEYRDGAGGGDGHAP
ncbi:PH domain-containing protein [Halorarum halophilum]|uniref:PH domain-containing protein n=1 Tax=Halorarum halophilum TaxID=2743090 RepID=A0A7D5GYG6_9EURY|nr:PH domain-containing protein [Halobaculum halophilum]QLG26833.1 PH domain-containing protein [Halobaculum halophilum]